MKTSYQTWKDSPSDWDLKANDIHVWRVPLDCSRSSVRALEELLSRDERMRAERFHFQRDRDRFIVADLQNACGG